MPVANDHLKVILIGSQGSGKSTLAANISGIYLATPTKCPIEWHFSPSAAWSATVSVAYYHPKRGSTSEINFSSPKLVGNICSTPHELQLLLTISEDTINADFKSKMLSGGVIHVNLQCPQWISKITIIDMPGMANTERAERLPVQGFAPVKQLIRHYAQSAKTIMAVVLPTSDVNSENYSPAISFVKSIDNDFVRTTVIANLIDTSAISSHFLEASQPYQRFFILPSTWSGPFACSVFEVQSLRQDEAAYFQFCEPWSSRLERDTLGVRNLLRAWDSSVMTSQLKSPQLSKHGRIGHGRIATACIWMLVSIIIITIPALCITV